MQGDVTARPEPVAIAPRADGFPRVVAAHPPGCGILGATRSPVGAGLRAGASEGLRMTWPREGPPCVHRKP